MPSTPSPCPEQELPVTPTAPKFGSYLDSWEPYRPRKSARIESKRAARTPSPKPSTSSLRSPPKTSARTDKKQQQRAHNAFSAMQARAQKASNAPVSASGMMTPSQTPRRTNATQQSSLLETPSKKPAKKYSGMTLDSFTVETEDDPFEIFTDSHDRVPTKDTSADNPFLGEQTQKTQTKHGRTKVAVPGVGLMTVAEASRRSDGSVYTFRGKPFFRLYEDASSKEANMAQPRLLFKKKTVTRTPEPAEPTAVDDEEALTDVEDDFQRESENTPECPKKQAITPPRHVTPEQAQTPAQNSSSSQSAKPAAKKTSSTGSSTSAQKSSLFGSFKFTKQRQTRSGTKRGADEPVDPAPTKRSRV